MIWATNSVIEQFLGRNNMWHNIVETTCYPQQLLAILAQKNIRRGKKQIIISDGISKLISGAVKFVSPHSLVDFLNPNATIFSINKRIKMKMSLITEDDIDFSSSIIYSTNSLRCALSVGLRCKPFVRMHYREFLELANS